MMKRKRLIIGFCARCQLDKELETEIDDNKEMICTCPDCLGFVKLPTENRKIAMDLLEDEKKQNLPAGR